MDDRADKWRLLGLSSFALVLRLVNGFSVTAPGNDGAHYLAQARELVNGDWSTALSCVFHPGKAMSFALLALFVDPFPAAILEGAVTGAVFVGLCYVIARSVAGPTPAFFACLLLAVSFAGVRLVGDVASETVYLPIAAVAVLAAVHRKPMIAGYAIAAAYWVRPEALALVPMLFFAAGRTVARPLLVVVGAVAGLAGARWLWTGELSAMVKAEFMYHMGPFGGENWGEVVSRLASNVAHLPLRAVAGLDYAVVPIAVVGFVLLSKTERKLARCVGISLLIGWAAMVVFQVKERFFLSQLPLFMVLFAAGLDRASGRLRRAAFALATVAAIVAFARVTVMDLFVEPPRRDKEIELVLGRRLGPREPGDLVTDLPRVAYAAGLHPLPPSEWNADELKPLIEGNWPLIVILGKKRPGRQEMMRELGGEYRETSLGELTGFPGADRIGTYWRRPRRIR